MKKPRTRRALFFVAVGVALGLSAAARADEDAIAPLAQALTAAETAEGTKSPRLLPLIGRLATAQRREGAFDKAAALDRRALDIAVAEFGAGTPQAVAALTALARLDLDRGRYLDAEGLLIAAQASLAAPGGDAGTPAAAIFAGLARVAMARGDNAAGEGWARRAVAAAGDNASDTEARRTLGAALTAESRFAEAETVLDRSLLQGGDAVDTARSLSQLANLYQRQGKPERALPLIEQAAELDQRNLGPSHPFIADDFYDLGLAYEALKQDDAARRAFDFAVRTLNRGVGRDTPRVAYAETQLSAIDRRAGKTEAADAEFRDAKRILDAADDADSEREKKI